MEGDPGLEGRPGLDEETVREVSAGTKAIEGQSELDQETVQGVAAKGQARAFASSSGTG